MSNTQHQALTDSECSPDDLVVHGFVGINDNGVIYIDGFEAPNSTCRVVGAKAMAWAIRHLQEQLEATKAAPGGDKVIVN